MHTAILSLILLLPVALSAAEPSWPQFRGPAGDGLADSQNPPLKWSEKENIKWKTAIPGKGWSSPVLQGDLIWLTTAPAEGKEFSAVCIDRKEGKILHNIKVFTEEKSAFCHPYNSYASCTPVIDGDKVYVHFGSVGTACLDLKSGEKIWERRDLSCNHHRGPASSPVIHENLLLLIFDGFDKQYVAALDKKTGKDVWIKKRDIQYTKDDGDIKKAYATVGLLKVGKVTQAICPSAETTIAYNVENGDEIWRVTHGGMNEAIRPIFGHGLVYLNSGHTSHMLAVRQGKTGDLTKTEVEWKMNRSVPTRSSPVLVGDYLYMVNDSGSASCVEAKTGKQVWQERVGKNYCASPIHAAGYIYLSDEEGQTHVIKAAPKYELVGVNKLDAGCMASHAMAGDELYIRTKTHLYCVVEKK